MLSSWTFYSRISCFPIIFLWQQSENSLPLGMFSHVIEDYFNYFVVWGHFENCWSYMCLPEERLLQGLGVGSVPGSFPSHGGNPWVCPLLSLSHTHRVILSSTNCYWPKKNDNKIHFSNYLLQNLTLGTPVIQHLFPCQKEFQFPLAPGRFWPPLEDKVSNSHWPYFFLLVFLRKFLALGVLGVGWAVINISDAVIYKFKAIWILTWILTRIYVNNY